MTNRKFTHPKDAEEGHKWQTIGEGLKVCIYKYYAGGDYPIHGAVYHEKTEEWAVREWDEGGTIYNDGELHPLDLVDAPRMVKVQGYVNVYPKNTTLTSYISRDEADYFARGNRIACIKIDIDVPEGRFDD